MTTRKGKIKGVLLLVFCNYVIVYVTAYLLRLVFIRQVFDSEEVYIVPALIFLIGFAVVTFLRLIEDVDESKETRSI